MICVQALIKEMIGHIGPKEPRFRGGGQSSAATGENMRGKKRDKRSIERPQI